MIGSSYQRRNPPVHAGRENGVSTPCATAVTPLRFAGETPRQARRTIRGNQQIPSSHGPDGLVASSPLRHLEWVELLREGRFGPTPGERRTLPSPALTFVPGEGLKSSTSEAEGTTREFGDLRLETSPDRRKLLITRPLASTTNLFTRRSHDGIVVSPDLGAILRPDDRACGVGVYANLYYGAPVAPWTPIEGISSIHGGCVTTIDHLGHVENVTRDPSSLAAPPDLPSGRDATLDAQADAIESALAVRMMERLAAAPSDARALLMFSGGADSSLLAVVLRRIAPDRTLLVHYTRWKDDEETTAARAIADELGLPIKVVDEGSAESRSVLDDVAAAYPFPFGDHSAIPTARVVRAALSVAGPNDVFFDGIGADGAFGLFGRIAQWERLARLPRPVTRLASAAFKVTRAWEREPGPLRHLRVLRKSMDASTISAALGQNCLFDILYANRTASRTKVDQEVTRWSEIVLPDGDAAVRLAAMDISHVCATVFAQKSKPIIEKAGRSVDYPFMSPEVMGIALEHAAAWPDAKTPKTALRHGLGRELPGHLAHRRKVGFTIRMTEEFARPEFLDRFMTLGDHTSPLRDFLDRPRLERIGDLMRRSRELPVQTQYFAFGAVFLDQWLRNGLGRPAAAN